MREDKHTEAIVEDGLRTEEEEEGDGDVRRDGGMWGPTLRAFGLGFLDFCKLEGSSKGARGGARGYLLVGGNLCRPIVQGRCSG